MFDLIHIYDGDGKGKTSAGLGVLLRAHGSGAGTHAFFFLKNGSSSELKALQSLGIPFDVSYDDDRYFWELNEKEKALFLEGQRELFKKASVYIKKHRDEVIILDEILDTVSMGIISEEELRRFLTSTGNELILTGRDGSRFRDEAGYYSHISKIKHPYDEGKEARKGIEY